MQFLCVKALSVNISFMQSAKARFISTVNLITQKWVSKIRQVHSYLMCSSCFKLALNIIKAVKALNYSIMCNCFTGGIIIIFDYRHFLSIDGMTSDWLINRARKLLKITNDNCMVNTTHRVSLKLLRKKNVCIVVFGNYQKTACVLINSMNNTRTRHTANS